MKNLHLPSAVQGAGVAIIFALMVLVVVSTLAIKHSWRSELDIKRAGHRWVSLQAKWYSQGAETLAVIALEKDLENSKADSLNELWASGFDFPTDHGTMSIRIVDAQSRLNLNELSEPFKNPVPQQGQNISGHPKYKPVHLRFLRLLQTIPLDEDETLLSLTEAEAVLEAVKDWVDADDTVEGFGGAEASYYSQLDIPITITNGDMVSVTELRNIKGITPALYQGLLPFVTSLPNTPGLNVNTMGSWLARTLNADDNPEPLSILEAEQLFDAVLAEEPETEADFNGVPFVSDLFPVQNGNQPVMSTSGLAYSSSWFELETTVTVGDFVRRSRSLIDRSSAGNVRVVRRSDGRF